MPIIAKIVDYNTSSGTPVSSRESVKIISCVWLVSSRLIAGTKNCTPAAIIYYII